MKHLNYLTSKEKRAVWLRAFHMWQRRPYEVAPLKNESHVCSSCKTEFTGNYCPRCGQAAGVGRFSFKKAMMLFLDVWAIGNRSMLRSIRDLMFRPGYMIRDYLSGMRSAYFPPFKMFFLLAAFSLIAEYGIDLGLSNHEKATPTEQTTAVPADSLKEDTTRTTQPSKAEVVADQAIETAIRLKSVDKDGTYVTVNGKKVEAPYAHAVLRVAKIIKKLWEKNPSIFALLTLMLFSLPLFWFLRHSPNIPDLRYSEFVVALVYTSNSYSIYSIIGTLLGSFIVQLIAVLMIFVTLKQLSGYSKIRLLGYITLSVLIVTITLIALVTLIFYFFYVALR